MLVNKHIFLNLHGSEYYSNGIGKSNLPIPSGLFSYYASIL